jgi:hypothetical protein
MVQKQKNRRERGNGLVETSLVFLVFVPMLIGTVDFAQFLFIHQALVERARSAARYGLVNAPSDTTSIQNMVLYNQPSTGNSSYFGLTSSMVDVSNPGSGTSDGRIVIRIHDYPYTMLSPYISGTHTGPNITVVAPVGN